MGSFSIDAVCLTGCGWVTPFASGTIDEVLAAASGEPPSPGDGYWVVPEALLDQHPDLAAELKGDKGAWVSALALEQARREAGLAPDAVVPERVGLVLGFGLAGQLGMINFANEVRDQSARFVSPLHFPQTVGNHVAGALARAYAIRGPNLTVACGAASGLDAIIEGCDLILSGQADVVFAGGLDVLSRELAQGYAEPGVLLSEGACLFVLESADRTAERGARALATVERRDPGAGPRASTDQAEGPFRSCAVSPLPGAIFIESWIGRCPGAVGAAAVAAAIAGAQGRPVPVVDPAGPDRVTSRPVIPDVQIIEHAAGPLVVFVDKADGHERTLMLMF